MPVTHSVLGSGWMKAITSRSQSAFEAVSRAISSPAHAFVLHYVGASFGAAERRITAIAARNLGSGVTSCFEIQSELLRNGSDPYHASNEELDVAERRMLDKFYAFVREHKNHFWFHWNMRNSMFGFSALENRQRELGGRVTAVPDQFRVDLADRMIDIYGDSYANPTNRLRSLAEVNGINVSYLIDGPEQGLVLESKDFAAGTRSLLNRIDVMYVVATRVSQRTLKTKSTFLDRISSAGGIVRWAKDHPTALAFAIAAPVVTVLLGLLRLWGWFNGVP